MQLTLLANGRVQVNDRSGFTHDIGPEHPEYQRLIAECLPQPRPNYSKVRLFGLLAIAAGLAAWWYNWHLAATEGHYYLKLTIFGPAGLFGGLLILARPDWSGRIQKDSSSAHKTAIFSLLGLIAVASGITFYLLDHYPFHPSTAPITPPRSAWSPDLTAAESPTILFLGHMYKLKSFHEKPTPTWEFGNAVEAIDDWTTLLTFIDRADARTRPDLDKLAEGVMANYKSHGGQILMAKTMEDSSGKPYDYLVAGFDDPDKQRFELNFVKMALGSKNATISIYGVRVSDPKDYKAKAKQFLDTESEKIGRTLAGNITPDLSKLSRKEF